MTSYELLHAINDFLNPRPSHEYLREVVSQLARIYDEYEPSISRLLIADPDKMEPVRVDTLRWLTGEMSRIRTQTQFRALFNAIENFQANLGELHDWTYVDGQNYFNDLRALVSTFSAEYEEFLRENNSFTFLQLLRASKNLHGEVEAVTHTLPIISKNLESISQVNEEHEEVLSLMLHPGNHLNVIVDKLQALVLMYEEVCRLLNVSTAEYPLRASKVESGSLWVRLFGESQVIKLITDLIRGGVQFLHRNYTQEGKVMAAPQRAQLIEANLNLEARLREQGIDTSDMRESIRKAGAVIAKESLKLLGGEASVGINDEYYSVGSAVDRLIAEKSTTKLLEVGNQAGTPLLGDGDIESEQSS